MFGFFMQIIMLQWESTIFRHLGLCQKPSKSYFYHKFCQILSQLGTYDLLTMLDKKQ